MKEIHQLVHTLSYGDAISTEVLALNRVLRDAGVNSEIFTINTHPHYQSQTKHYSEFPKQSKGDVVLHYSLGSPLNDLYRNLSGWKRSIIYHNLTPASWFKSVNARVFKDISAGVEELPGLLTLSDLVIADSKFNASELIPYKVKPTILGLPVDPARWSEPANPGIKSLVANDPKLHILHVGRIAPNKCIEDIIKAFYFLHHHIERESKLWLVGIDHDTELYSFGLKRLAQELHISDAIQFVGRLSDSEVRALYETCAVYVCMSEHEGFCLPLIEAMHFGIPVLAWDGSAITETVGNSSILISEKNPAAMAELMYLIAKDNALRDSLVSKGKERVKDFSFDAFANQAREIFGLV